jgi:hypothetical protein
MGNCPIAAENIKMVPKHVGVGQTICISMAGPQKPKLRVLWGFCLKELAGQMWADIEN